MEILRKINAPSLWEYVILRAEDHGLKLINQSQSGAEYCTKDNPIPLFKLVKEADSIRVIVYCSKPFEENPYWLDQLIHSYMDVLNDWSPGHEVPNIVLEATFR